MWKPSGQTCLVAVLCCAAAPHLLHATGDYGTGDPYWLDTGNAIDKSPEFFWESQMRQLSQAYKPVEKPLFLPLPGTEGYPPGVNPTYADQCARADAADFAEAVKKGLIKTADAASAEAKHKAARDTVAKTNEATAGELPAEEPSEFADYHRGAFAFHRGEKHYPEAKAAWEALLSRPAKERHYRSVWAAFMLGKLAVFAGDREAVKWFHEVRKLAAEGFADSTGLAADSYGWEAKIELDQGHMEKAAKLYLTQLSLGDDSAVVSLKAFVPDRGKMDYQLSFDTTGHALPADKDLSDSEKEAMDKAAVPAMAESAKVPVLRAIITAHILATETVMSTEPGSKRGEMWLDLLEQAHLKDVEDADKLGWVAYASGKYGVALRWLKLQKADTATSLWLQAKLARRAGKTDEAVKLMAASLHAFGPVPKNDEGETHFQRASHGDMAVLHLSKADYMDALDQFVAGDLHTEATYLLEQVLTTEEAVAYVNQHFPEEPESKRREDGEAYNYAVPMRMCLASRLVREDRYKEARAYFRPEEREVLDKYVALLDKAADTKLPKKERARAWFDAANIVTDHGEQLMDYGSVPVERYRDRTPIPGASKKGKLSERQLQDEQDNDKPDPTVKPPLVTADEKKRIAKYRAPVFKGGFVKHVASVLIWKSAELLPDQSDELADVLNTGGNWIKGDYRGDDAAADKFFQAIERRASHTDLGKEAGKAHWFVDNYGPWSSAPKEK